MPLAVALYPGTFDPMTNGHVAIIQRAHRLFDRVIVCVATSDRKNPFLTLDERVALVRKVIIEFSNVHVEPLKGLVVDFAKQQGANCIVRGLRAVSDFDYEFQLAGMNRALNSEVETLFLAAEQQTTHISATMVKEIVNLGGDITKFVPDVVAQYLQSKK
ncbi:MAG: pantetheine-phosphate adenylyltransferase [Coxiella sp. RIFCSPHIGHO2_12_FULL_44_14]|nr:MAG: pantetheine-phosphate adenylyltransferase [Coxiella sp. RIFCSPHIGHO2_12_FULL_44_14]